MLIIDKAIRTKAERSFQEIHVKNIDKYFSQ